MSKKRTEASRTNGAASKGPTSPEGKARSRTNARKEGLFAKELVITELGETWDEFDEVRDRIRTSFRPMGLSEELLCEDLAENWFRRQRVRRCEAAEIRRAIRGADLLADVDRGREASFLKEKLMRLVAEQIRTKSPTMGAGNIRGLAEIQVDMDAIRRELVQSSAGLDFLLETLEAVVAEADAQGKLSDASELLLCACLGSSDESAAYALSANAFIRKRTEGERGQVVAPGDTKEPCPAEDSGTESGKGNIARPFDSEELKQWDSALLVTLIRSAQMCLALDRKIIRLAELAANDPLVKVAGVLTSSNLNRAETSYDRRFYKTLAMMYAIRFQQAQIKLAHGRLAQPSKKGPRESPQRNPQ